jgi:hypothetical protein
MTETTDHHHAEDFVHAFDTPTQVEGEIATSRLKAEGIPVIVKEEVSEVVPAGTVQLWVPADRADEARALFEELGVGNLEVDED